MSKYRLTYFNGRARAETSRMLFEMAGVEYEDNRVTGEAWQEFKTKAPMGQVPCLEVDGKMYCQSHAIERFLANRFGFYGDSDEDRLKNDMVVDCLEDMFKKVTAIFSAPDEEKPKLKAAMAEKDAKPILENIEKLVNAHGFLVSNKISWADIALYITLENMTAFEVPVQQYVDAGMPKLKSIQDKVAAEPKIAAWIEKRPQSSF